MIRQILLVPHTHHDVGYTASPRIVDDLHVRVVGEVLRLCAIHDGPGPDRFRWTFEVARPVLRFVERADHAAVERLRGLIRDERISVTGGYLNMTQLPSAAELDAGYDALEALRAVGIPVRTEQHGDVNGIAWGSVEAMRRAGIDRLVMALNPDHGRAPHEQPTAFWWESPAGRRVFVWLSTHYGVGEQWGVVDGDTATAEARIAGFVRRLEERTDYPFDAAVVHAANDNRWPTAKLLDVARQWNTRHPEAPMRTATVDQALDVLQAQARDAGLAVVRGEWSDWWSHGHGSTAREVAVYREARSFARAAQTGLALSLLRDGTQPRAATAEVIGYRRGPVRLRGEDEIVADLARVDEQLLLFGEHTWGSWETYRRPHSTFSHSHWNAKAGFAYAAYDLARDLAIEAMFRVAAPDGTAAEGDGEGVLVVNPTERDRTEPVVVEVDGAERRRLVATAPAFGVALVPLPGSPRRADGHELTLGAYRVHVDPASGGVVSLVDVRSGRELVDGAAGHGLGAVVVERPVAGRPHPMLHGDLKAFHPDTPGPGFDRIAAAGDEEPEIAVADGLASITWHTSAPGVPAIRTTLTLYADVDAVDLEVDLVKPERFGPESIFVAFPFAVDDPAFLVETAGAVYAAGSEQLPDTSKDWFSIQHAVGVTNGIHGVLWGSFDAPLVQLGGFHTGEWARELEVRGGHVNSWLMNNLHFTNFQARQDGTRRYRYRFAAIDAAVTRERVAVYGRDLLEPLQARQYRGPVEPGGRGLRVEPTDRVLAEVRPAGGGAARVRLRNVTGELVDAAVVWDGERHDVRVRGYGTADVVVGQQGRLR